MDPVLRAGTAEYFKAGWHLAMFGMAVACCGYAGLAFSERRERHLAVNVAVYSVLFVFEFKQIARHLRAVERA